MIGNGQYRCRRVSNHLQADIVVAEIRQAVALAELHHFALNEVARQRRDREAGENGGALAGSIGAQESDAELAARARQLLHRIGPPDTAILPHRYRQRILQMRVAALGAGPDQLLLHQDFAVSRRSLGEAVEDGNVEPVLVDLLAHGIAHADRHVDRHVRIGLRKTLQHFRQDAFADILGRTDTHDAIHVRQQEARHRFIVERQQPAGKAEQHFPFRRQRHRARVT
ncbi:hypothetical protein D9M72_522380 [compost metagenome]